MLQVGGVFGFLKYSRIVVIFFLVVITPFLMTLLINTRLLFSLQLVIIASAR